MWRRAGALATVTLEEAVGVANQVQNFCGMGVWYERGRESYARKIHQIDPTTRIRLPQTVEKRSIPGW
jgi:hypothetical protein